MFLEQNFMNNTSRAHLALLGANIIYGANYLIAKGVMPNKIGPSAFVFLRILGAGILFWIIKSFIKEKVSKRDLRILALCGLLGVATNQLLFFHGLNLTSPIDASIIITSIPVMVLIFSALFPERKNHQEQTHRTHSWRYWSCIFSLVWKSLGRNQFGSWKQLYLY